MVKLKIMSTSNKVIFVHHKNRRGNIILIAIALRVRYFFLRLFVSLLSQKRLYLNL